MSRKTKEKTSDEAPKKRGRKKAEKVVEKKADNLSDVSFLNRSGKDIKIGSLIDQDDCWFLKKEGKWVLTHKAIQKIADAAGISKNFEVAESSVMPEIKNELEHIVRVTIHCKAADGAEGGCVHDFERELTITGEANKISAPHLGRGYLRKMAEKRAFDIAVLQHVGLYTSVFSEEESEKFEKKEIKEYLLQPGMKEFEDIVPFINKILNAMTIPDMEIAQKDIVDNKNILSETQVRYLRELYTKEFAKKSVAF
jgi:hypothetical protein